MPRSLTLVTLSLLSPPTIGACAGGDPSAAAEWVAVVDTVADTVVVRTTSGSVWGDTMVLVPEVEIGVLEGAPELIFGSIVSFGVDSRGRMWLMDGQVPELRVFEADGGYAMTVGRPGEGPGEFKGPDGGLAILSDDRVLVRDPANARIQVFGPDGEPLDTWQIRGNFNTSQPLWRDTANNVYTNLLLDPEADLADWRFGLAQYRPDGSPGDTLVIPDRDWEEPFVEGRNESSVNRNRIPFSPREAWFLHPDGYFVSGISEDYRFTVLRDPSGDDLPVRIERAWEPAPVTPGEASQARERITRNMRRNFPSWRWNGPDIPKTKAAYRDLFVGEDGRIWVLVSVPSVEVEDPFYDPSDPNAVPDTWEEPVAFDVFEPDGRFLGHVRAPAGLGVNPRPRFNGDYAWGVTRDEFDVQRFVRYRIEPAGKEGTDGAD
jgi:hypothetical protein